MKRRLLESMCRNFPAGSLLRMKNNKGSFFAPREFAGAPALNGHTPSYLILDGQQRLTSLYQALYGTGAHRYFINFDDLMRGSDLEDCVCYLRKGQAKKSLGSLEQQAATLTFPFASLLGSDNGFEEWLDRILELRPETVNDRKALKQRLRDARKASILNVEGYEFPMVTLASDTPSEAVCTIFETLNRTGVKLSVFDLLAARFWAQELRLRDLWDQAQDEAPIIAEFEVDPYYLLQAVAIFAAKAAPSCKRSDVLALTVEQIRHGWAPVVRGLADVLRVVRDDCGVVLPQWLPYYPMLIPAAALFASKEGIKGPEVAAVKAKLRRWFWCSVFGQSYDKPPNSQAVKDYGELRRWLGGGEPPESVAKFTFDAASLRETTARQRAVYKGVIALILRNGARDFHKDSPITASMMLEAKIEDHHMFPQQYLQDTGLKLDANERDCVLNRTLIDKTTNGSIGKRAPSVYLENVRKALGSTALKELLGSHLIPCDDASPPGGTASKISSWPDRP